MQIWHFTKLNPRGIGGVETLIANISKFLDAAGLTVFAGDHMPAHFDESARTIVHTHGDRWLLPLDAARLRRHPNLKIVHISHGTSIGRMFACREFHKISTWRGSVKDFLCLAQSDAYVAVSAQASHEVASLFRIRKKHAVIPNGVNVKVFSPVAQITDDPVLFFAGRAGDRVKNTDFLIRACERASGKFPSLKLKAAPGLDSRSPVLTNLGPLNETRLAQEIASSRAIVLCSFYEGDPIILREAQAMGIPVIASDIPQIRQNLDGYQNAFFIDPRRIETLEAAIGLALAPTSSLKPAPKARSWETVASEYLDFYKSLF